MSKRERPKLQMGELSTASERPTLMTSFTGLPSQFQQTDLALEEIRPRSNQPRRSFGEAALAHLTESVRRHGILQPLTVHRLGAGYELIAGERRLRAARAAGLSHVPVKIFETLPERQVQQLSAIENLQREDLNPVDEADALLDILEIELSLERSELVQKLHRWKALKVRDPALTRLSAQEREQLERLEALFSTLSRGEWTSFVTNRLPVLKLPGALLEAVRSGDLEYTKAVALKRLPEEAWSALLAQAPSLSVAQTRQKVRALLEEGRDETHMEALAGQVRRLLGRGAWQGVGAAERRRVEELLVEVRDLLQG